MNIPPPGDAVTQIESTARSQSDGADFQFYDANLDYFSHGDVIGTAIGELDTPVALLDMDIFERNARSIATSLQDVCKDWRPHVKAHKSPFLAKRLIELGAVGVTCAKLSEAEIMARHGVTNILIANELATHGKWRRLAELQATTTVMACVDDARHVEWAAAAATEVDTTVSVLIDVDTGMGRTGLRDPEAVGVMAEQIANSPGVRLAGLMAYEGHLLTIPDKAEKKRQVQEAAALLVRCVAVLKDRGLQASIISGGGSGTLPVSDGDIPLTESQAGGGCLMDEFYANDCSLDYGHALTLMTSVVSTSHPGQVVTDSGFKTLNSLPGMPMPTVRSHPGYRVAKINAEHGILDVAEPAIADPLQIGDRVTLIPGYSDAMLVLHNFMIGHRAGVVTDIIELTTRGALR